MASWMVHLRVADRLLDRLKDIDEAAFVMGNIAPDSGVPNADWTEFHPPKSVSHFKTDRTDPEAFRRQYFSREQIAGYDRRAYSFFLGYYVHLLTDVEWVAEILTPLRRELAGETKEARDRYIQTAKEDWYDLDFLYLEQHPEFRAFHIYENTRDFENDLMERFSADAFENRRAYICAFYHGDEHGALHRDYAYLTPQQAEVFVEKAAEKIAGML